MSPDDRLDPDELPVFDEEDDDRAEPPRSRWATAREIAGGLVALVLLSIGVLILYLVGAVASGAIAYAIGAAAPVVFVLAGAVLLARYLSK